MVATSFTSLAAKAAQERFESSRRHGRYCSSSTAAVVGNAVKLPVSNVAAVPVMAVWFSPSALIVITVSHAYTWCRPAPWVAMPALAADYALRVDEVLGHLASYN